MGFARAGSNPADVALIIYIHFFDYFIENLKLVFIIDSVVVLSGSVPESGQRGATQDRLHYASWVQIPPLPLNPM